MLWILNFLKEYKEAIALVGAGWALWLYRDSKKKEAAEWLNNLFKGFYVDAEFRRMRMQLEYDTKLNAIIKKVLPEKPHVITDETEERLLSDLDAILNYFELILHLE